MIFEFVKKTCISHILSKALDISSDSVWVPPDLLKALIILSDKTIRRAVVDLEKLKSYWKSEKRLYFSNDLLSTIFSKILHSAKRVLTGWQFLSVNLTPTFLNTRTTNETLQQSGKWDSFRHVCLKVQAYNYSEQPLEYSQDQTPLTCQYWLTFLRNLGVVEIICSCRLVLEKKVDK